MSVGFLKNEMYLSKVDGQRVKVMHQRGDPKNQPKAGPEAKVRESASHHVNFQIKKVFLKHFFSLGMRPC